LVLGQCTTVLLDKLKQDSDWQTVSDSYDPLKLLKLVEKYILKQSDNQYRFGIVIEQLKLLLTYRQDDRMTNAAYYDRFKTRVDVAEHIGVSFDNPVLWDVKSQELYSMDYDQLLMQQRSPRSRTMPSRHSLLTSSSSTAMIRRPWQMIMQRETLKPTQTVVMQL
jgi:hypothetical protein